MSAERLRRVADLDLGRSADDGEGVDWAGEDDQDDRVGRDADNRANAAGAAGVSIFAVVAVVVSAAVGELTVSIALGALAWIVATGGLWIMIISTRPAVLLLWPVLLSASVWGLTAVSPVAASLLVTAQTLGFVFIGQTNPPGRFVVLLPLAWATAFFAYNLPLHETVIRLTIATIIWAACAELPARLVARLHRLANTDPLTGLANRAQMYQVLAAFDRRTLTGRPAPALVLLDLDHFKLYNDTEGHLAGDELLVSFGRCVTTTLRSTDLAYRFGGEEFLLVLDHTDLRSAVTVVERLRRNWAQVLPCTFSAGVATSLRRADECLYTAKAGGRDRTTMDGEVRGQEQLSGVMPHPRRSRA
ncbi:GGDEF domain-containing protein [Solicola sp. PLA-1-18]|uniref:GGDEF domain-containing protein n=1 Tax=Solicola sp. PLA-1-18 TaxID=3380532 RepID=UPI003B7F366C